MTDYTESATVAISWTEDGVTTTIHTKQYVRKYPWGDGDVSNSPTYTQSSPVEVTWA